MEEIQFQNKIWDVVLSEVSFFCPAYNDEENLPALIPAVYKFLSEVSKKFEIIIIEDCSPDKTGEVAKELARIYPYTRVVHHPKNLGYGGALKDGFANARYEYIMYTDGDNQYDINQFGPYLPLLAEFDVISGYAAEKAVSSIRKIQSNVFNSLVRMLFFVNLKDINCSMKIYKRHVVQQLDIKSDSAFIDAEMLIKAKRKGLRIAQFPVTQYKRKKGLASGSKISIIANTIKDMIEFRLGLL